ncbi:histidinol-phosphate transaminase [Oculatella sp. LEGE 06141]|uniref:histidinol-phosphate transaminase n=1 Tax=Oculatella sp. LEGE 06141 TaxID=1828648 RepID=UPI001880270E|nr:histidinol-phosphate transaminase [Oculatella sp. LEGE 06141]MBE9181772.1 histidinol-phosphate transaminase [Oculatella sp. LEGE 06141]
MLPFLRSDLAQLTAYTPHPGGMSGSPDPSASGLAPATIDRLDTNENPYDLPDDLKQKLLWMAQQTIESNRYPDGAHGTLRAAIAHYVTQSAALTANWVTSNHISVSNGSDELIRSILIATCLKGEGAVLVAQPTFSMYGILAETLGIPVVTVGRSDVTFELDVAAAQSAIEQTQHPPIRVVFMVHPNSPTGNALTQAELNWLRSLPEQVLVVVDEAYFEFSQTTVVGELPSRSNWMVLRTFSKAFRLAGHRVGYAIAHPELIATLEKVRLPYNLPSLSQAAAQLAITHQQTLLSIIPEILGERDRLTQILSAHPALQVWPSDANFIFVRLREPGGTASSTQGKPDLNQLFEQLKAQGTLVRQINHGLRITVGSPAENQRTIDRIQALLKS